QRDAPGEPRLRPADREILERVAQEPEDLVPIALGADQGGALLDVPNQPVLVLRHPEEVVLLLEELEPGEVLGARAVDRLLLRVETLAADPVEPSVRAEVDLAPVVERLEDRLDDALVPRLGGADEVVVRDAEPPPRLAEDGRDRVGVRLGRDARLGRRLGDLVAVLVGAGQEVHGVAGQAPVAAHRVGDDRRVRVAEVRARVDVVDRRREVERTRRGHCGGGAPGGVSWAWACGRPSQVSSASGTSASVPSGKPTSTGSLRTRSDLILPVMQPPPPHEAWQGVLTFGSRARSSW